MYAKRNNWQREGKIKIKTVGASYPETVQRDTKPWSTGKFFKQEKVWTRKSAYWVRTKKWHS